MAVIKVPLLAQAQHNVVKQDLQAKAARCDRIHARHPGLLYSVFVPQRYAVSMAQIELQPDLLLVFDDAMRAAWRIWPAITEDVQERCLKRVTGRVLLVEGLLPAQLAQAIKCGMESHPETPMLALVFSELRHARCGAAWHRD